MGTPSAQGWRQFLTSRREMLHAYDVARVQASAHEVETHHGNVAEGEFRKWLAGFLPKRYGVTSGYVVSQMLSEEEQKLPHYDVIIYDALNSPVLWIEGNPDKSSSGHSRAIPAEYVHGVIEVKAALTPSSARLAIEHLEDLRPLMTSVDPPGERYKRFLPANFFCATVFFELRKEHQYSESALRNLIPGRLNLRGFAGGLVLRGEGRSTDDSAGLRIVVSETPIESMIAREKASLLAGGFCESIERVGRHWALMLRPWSEPEFSHFAFDLIAIMNGTYDPGRLSSFHGFGFSDSGGATS